MTSFFIRCVDTLSIPKKNPEQTQNQEGQNSLRRYFQVENNNDEIKEPPPLPYLTEDNYESNNNEDSNQESHIKEGSIENVNQHKKLSTGDRKKNIIKAMQALKGKFTYYTERNKETSRTRGFVQCNTICSSGPCKGQQCTYTARFSSNRKSYDHTHRYDLGNQYKAKPSTIPTTKLTDTLVDLVATTNISFRKASSHQFTNLLDECIQYGFTLGKINRLTRKRLVSTFK